MLSKQKKNKNNLIIRYVELKLSNHETVQQTAKKRMQNRDLADVSARSSLIIFKHLHTRKHAVNL